MKALALQKEKFHSEWNYIIHPKNIDLVIL